MMKYKLLLILGICIGAVSQLMMKHGVKTLGGLDSFPDKAAMLIGVFTSPYILLGLVCTGVSMLIWLTVISKLELSFAYPFVALSYIIILIFGWLFFSENVNMLRVAGIFTIMAGVVIISRTGGDGETGKDTGGGA